MLFYQPLISEGRYTLDPDESRHCIKVLRKGQGDFITITDGKGYFYECRLTGTDVKACPFEVVNKKAAPEKDFSVHIAISPTKSPDRIEWFVEKSVEIGVDRITFVLCERTEKSHLKQERLLKKAISAMKQSLQATLPVIKGPILLGDFLDGADATDKFIAHNEGEKPAKQLVKAAKSGGNYAILIGPEGGFTEEEVEKAQKHDFLPVQLGTTRLRTETAGIAACHTLHVIQEQLFVK